ncbi:MAG: hypothetical protein OXI43_13940 [Candidatus Poribacteria bacterium]|nr:hypothetical protein [Candidatus Poribacteria bacterium]
MVESRDVALVDIRGQVILDAIRDAYPPGIPCELDGIWFVDTVGDLSGGIVFRDFTPCI